MSGKSTFMQNLLYYNRDKFPTAKAFVGNEDGYNEFRKIIPPIYIMNYYDEEEHSRWCVRQGKLIQGKHPSPGSVCICDDVVDSRATLRRPPMNVSFKRGSQHWRELFIVATQEAMDVENSVRNNASFVALGRNNDAEQRKKMYLSFGGVCGNRNRFEDMMDQICEDYTFMIIRKNGVRSNKVEECVFYYKTRQLSKWKFGCNEYRAWSKERYNSDYHEDIFAV